MTTQEKTTHIDWPAILAEVKPCRTVEATGADMAWKIVRAQEALGARDALPDTFALRAALNAYGATHDIPGDDLYESAYGQFCAMADKGVWGFALACERVRRDPWRVPLPFDATPGMQAVATLAFYLADGAEAGEPIFLPTRKVGLFLDRSKSTAANILAVLRAHGVIRRTAFWKDVERDDKKGRLADEYAVEIDAEGRIGHKDTTQDPNPTPPSSPPTGGQGAGGPEGVGDQALKRAELPGIEPAPEPEAVGAMVAAHVEGLMTDARIDPELSTTGRAPLGELPRQTEAAVPVEAAPEAVEAPEAEPEAGALPERLAAALASLGGAVAEREAAPDREKREREAAARLEAQAANTAAYEAARDAPRAHGQAEIDDARKRARRAIARGHKAAQAAEGREARASAMAEALAPALGADSLGLTRALLDLGWKAAARHVEALLVEIARGQAPRDAVAVLRFRAKAQRQAVSA